MFLMVYFEKNMYVLHTYVTPPSLMHILALCCFTHCASLGTPVESDPHKHKSSHSPRGSVMSGNNNITKSFFFSVFIFLRTYLNEIFLQDAVPRSAEVIESRFPDFSVSQPCPCAPISHIPPLSQTPIILPLSPKHWPQYT